MNVCLPDRGLPVIVKDVYPERFARTTHPRCFQFPYHVHPSQSMRCQTSGRSCIALIFQPSPDPLHQKAAVKAGMFLFGVDAEFVSSNLFRIEELLSLVGSQGTVGKPVARLFFQFSQIASRRGKTWVSPSRPFPHTVRSSSIFASSQPDISRNRYSPNGL